MPVVLNVNSEGARKFTKKLTMMHKSAFPNAVRSALNSAAFDVKKDTMPKSAKKAFINRDANFFKANSSVEMATGFKVSEMKATVGFLSTGLKNNSKNFAVKDLDQQEDGGKIKKKSFIPINSARASGSNNKKVRPVNRLTAINSFTTASQAKGKNEKEKFVKSVIHAGQGGRVMAQRNGKTMMWRVNTLKRDGSWHWKFKLTALYSFRKGRGVNVKGKHFMKRASLISGDRIEKFYIQAALKTFNKIPR